MATYGRQAKSGFLWGMSGRAATIFVGLGTSIVVARLLTPYDFGVAAAAAFFVQVAQRLTNLGFNTALMRLPNMREEHSASVFTINVAFGIIGMLLLTMASPWLAGFYRSPEAGRVIPVAGVTFAIGCLGTVPSALLARQLRFRALVIIETLYGCVIATASVVMALAGFGYWSLVYSLLIGAIFDAIVKFAVTRWRPSLVVSRAALRDLWSFGAGLHVKRLLDSLALNIDNMVVGRTLGISMLGIYDKAFTTMNRAVTMMSSAGQIVSISVLGRIQEDHERFRQAFRKVTLGVTIVGYPTFGALALMGRPLFLVLFGAQWTDAILPFQMLCVAGMLKLLISYVSAAVQAKGRVWGEVWRQALYLSMIISAVIIGSWWGLPGAAAGVLVATGVMTVLMCDLLRRLTALSWMDLLAPQLPGLTCAVGIGISVIGARFFYQGLVGTLPGVWAQLGIEGGVSGFFYCTFLLACPFRDARELVRETVFDFAPGLGRRLRLPLPALEPRA